MDKLKLSKKGQKLITLYEKMVSAGYERSDNKRIENAFSDFELRAYRAQIKPILEKFSIATVLDYGCGGSDWNVEGFDEQSDQSALTCFGLDKVCRYEPARNLDERQPVDCVISFDVLEHIFISDIPSVIRDMFRYAGRLIILNVACYRAAAKLPNGENAHITVRQPHWWKGMLDSICLEYPGVSVCLICSTGWRKSRMFPIWNANMWQNSDTYVIEI
ncbi:MAG: hypothetical protein WD601_02660 [Pseudohongiellaceae bacterium]